MFSGLSTRLASSRTSVPFLSSTGMQREASLSSFASAIRMFEFTPAVRISSTVNRAFFIVPSHAPTTYPTTFSS